MKTTVIAAVGTQEEADRLRELNDAFKSKRLLREAVEWFEKERPQWGPGTLPTWYVDATK